MKTAKKHIFIIWVQCSVGSSTVLDLYWTVLDTFLLYWTAFNPVHSTDPVQYNPVSNTVQFSENPVRSTDSVYWYCSTLYWIQHWPSENYHRWCPDLCAFTETYKNRDHQNRKNMYPPSGYSQIHAWQRSVTTIIGCPRDYLFMIPCKTLNSLKGDTLQTFKNTFGHIHSKLQTWIPDPGSIWKCIQ